MQSKDLVIIGLGGHGLVLLDAVLAAGCNVLGYFDANVPSAPKEAARPISKNEFAKLNKNEILLVNGVGSLPQSRKNRFEVFQSYKNDGYQFATIVHPNAYVSPFSKLEEGAQIMAGSVVQPASTVGENTIVNTGVSIDHGCEVGGYCHISPGATLCGDVLVDQFCHIGAGSVIMQGTKIGFGATIGAGTTVSKDIEQKTTWIGSSAVKLQKTFDFPEY